MTLCCTFFLPILRKYDVKMPNFVFYGERNPGASNEEILFRFPELEYGRLEFKFKSVRVHLTK